MLAKRPTVVICDRCDARRRLIADAVEQCGARVRVVADVASIDASAAERCGSIVTVALGPHFDEHNPSIDAIRQLAANGLTIIAHGETASDWPLSMRCRALLAGTLCLLRTRVRRSSTVCAGSSSVS